MFINNVYILKESDPFTIKAREEVTINLELVKSFHYCTLLIGKVLDKNLPIKNATIMVLDFNGNPLYTTVTDEKGVYKFRHILKPGKYKVMASAMGYKTSRMKTIYINENSITKISFELTKSLIFVNGIVYGKILESGSKKPIENAIIYLKSLDNGCKKVYKTTSNCSGQYLIYNVLPGKYIIIIEKKGYLVEGPIELTIEKYDRILLYFDLIKDNTYCNSTISGIITFNKAPICGAPVFLYYLDKEGNEEITQSQETNESGVFLFSNVKSGSYIVKSTMQNDSIYEKRYTIE